MGKANRQRRADKEHRARRRAHHAGGRSPGDSLGLDQLVIRGIYAAVVGDVWTVLQISNRLTGEPMGAVLREAERLALVQVRNAWDHGWQPAELHRHGQRIGSRQARIVAAAIAADHSIRDRSTLDPRWAVQIDALSLPQVDGANGWLVDLLDQPASRDGMQGMLEAIAAVAGVPSLSVLLPPPGAGRGSTAASSPTDDPILARVRALLAQAESTNFEAEAATFTAKAQELMARHAVDAAMVWSGNRDDAPATIRLPVDDPYADNKALLLHVVAEANRCRSVWSGDIGLASVIGFTADLTTTEVLFTSLLVQAASAMQAEAISAPPGARVRSASFRSSFLRAYTGRVGQRLAKVDADVVAAADAELSGTLLPVLADRGQVIDEAVAEQFPSTRSMSVRSGWDGLGHERGWSAGGRALLGQEEVSANATNERRALGS